MNEEGYGIIINNTATSSIQFKNIQTYCDVEGCEEIASNYFIRGEDKDFLNALSISWYKDTMFLPHVAVVGLCKAHTYCVRLRDEDSSEKN